MIQQAKFSKVIKFFEKNFLECWNLREYHDPNSSCIFVGLYDEEDLNNILRHKGMAILLQTGRRNKEINDAYLERLVLKDNLFFIHSDHCTFPSNAKIKNIHLPIKDYSAFKPVVLGDIIYAYMGSDRAKSRYGYELAEEIKKHVPYKIQYGMLGLPIEQIKKTAYDKCFLNLNLSPSGCGGFTTAYELGYMGRYSITTSDSNIPCFLKFKSFDHILNIIEEQSKRIGTIPLSLMNGYHMLSDDWKNEDFWI